MVFFKSLNIKLAIGFLCIIATFHANAQNYSQSREVVLVYTHILKGFRNPLAINSQAQNFAFKKTYFKKPGYHQLDSNNIKPVDSGHWQEFLGLIDTSRILNYKLRRSLIVRYRAPFKFRGDRSIITLSSPVFSNDYRLCVCYVNKYSSPENAAGLLYYLEKRSRKWKIVKTTMVYIS